MNNVLIIGVGGTGSDAVDMLYKRIQTLKGEKNFRIKAVVFDTDDGDMAKIGEATTVSMSQNGTVGTVCDKLGVANVEEWFPFDDPAIRALPMNKGAGQWRKKSFLAFMAAMEQPERSLTFHRVMDSLFDSTDRDATYQIYTVASLAGGTGSGSFIPITLYAKRYMLETMHASSVQTAAVLACPGIYADQQTTEENRSKVYANAYAILRELNAMNLVANGYNNSDADIHHAPIKFKLGAEGTQVGVLFDSSDEKYWEATKATPFNNVFLFDKILGCESIKKHNEVLADSLFTVLCTSIGVAIDSEMDNHILLRALAQNTAIYASLGTSRLEYPKDTLLDYLAHKKALDAADGDWMTLYHKVEDYFREADKQAKDSGKTRYYMKEGEYSLRVEEVYNNLKKEGLFSADLKELFNLGLEQYDPVKDEPVDRLAPFFDKMDKEVVSRIPGCGMDSTESDTPVAVITAKRPLERPGLLEGKKGLDAKKSTLVRRAKEYSEELQIYYAKCVKTIRDSYRNIAETILSFDLHTDGEKVTSPLSFINGVLKTEGRFIHPVAAMVAIARAENYFRKKLADIKERPWEDLLKDKAGELPIDLYVDAMNETSCLGKNEKGDKSAYRKISDGRFLTLATGDAVRVADAYLQASSTDVCVDSKFLMADAVETAANVESSAKKQLKKAVYTLIVERLELLMEEYKRFFKNFEEEKGGLAQRTADYEKMNSGMSGGVINVGSSPEEKRKLYEEMNDDVSGASLEDLKDGYDVVGRSAFRMAYEIAKLKGNKGAYDEDDADTSRLFKGLFDSMVESYKQQISKGKFYEEFYEANVFEALAKGQNDPEKKRRAVGEKLGKVINLAEPSMKQDNLTSAELQSSQITVVMVPLKAAKYLRKNAASLGIVVQGDDTVGDPNNTRTYLPYAEQFVRACYPSQLKVVVASGIPDNVVYVTKENSDLQPIHIRDLCEDKDGTYYREYSKMVRIVDGISEDGKKIESTDIANPHLGFNLHKRGYLPFIDPKKEAESDTDMFKALLYGLFSGQITYGTMARRGTGFRYFENGKETSIRDGENRFVDMGNLAGLVQWIRPLVGKISEWSKEFDKALEAQCRSFPTVEDESASAVLEGWITRSQYVSYMRDNVFDEINKANKGGEQIKPASLMEFAYKIKTSEESTVDCDDAEKLLKVGYETLCTVCRFRIGRDSSDTLASVINQQTEKFVIALCTNIGLGSLGYARTILSWANNNGCFVDIPTDNNSLDRNGQFRVTAPFAFDEDWIEKRVNEELARRGKKADAPAETPAADDEMQD